MLTLFQQKLEILTVEALRRTGNYIVEKNDGGIPDSTSNTSMDIN